MNWLDISQAAIDHHGAQQDPHELAALLVTLDDQVRPRCILEIGFALGGSLWAFAQLTTVERIVAVDRDLAAVPTYNVLPEVHTTLIQGDSTAEDTRIHVTGQLAPFSPDVVFIDGDHGYSYARSDYDTYGPLCGEDGVIVLHDTQGHPEWDTNGPGQLLAEIRKERAVTEFVSVPGGPFGTGIIWPRWHHG